MVVCTPLPVKPENFDFTLSAYTDGTIHQYPVDCGLEPLRGSFLASSMFAQVAKSTGPEKSTSGDYLAMVSMPARLRRKARS